MPGHICFSKSQPNLASGILTIRVVKSIQSQMCRKVVLIGIFATDIQLLSCRNHGTKDGRQYLTESDMPQSGAHMFFFLTANIP